MLPDRFMRFVSPEPNSGCWLWTGSTTGVKQYGRFYDSEVRGFVRAHRWSYAHVNGPIVNRLFVLHKCDTPACVNPQHLFLGTSKENAEDCVRKGRNYKGGAYVPWTRVKTHCKRGHPLSGDNLVQHHTAKHKKRVCLACMRLKWDKCKERRNAQRRAENAALKERP